MSSPGQIKSSVFALLACAIAYLYATPHFPELHNPNENIRVQMTAALVDHGTYEISRVRARWGFANDAACVDHAPDGTLAPCEGPTAAEGHHRRIVSVKAPLASWLGVPAYAALRAMRGDAPISQTEATYACRLGGSLLPILALLLAVRRFFAIDLGDSPFAREAGFFALALGSVTFGYALLFVSHSTSAIFAFVAFAQLVFVRRSGSIGKLDAAATGFAASAVTALEYPALLVSVVLCIGALRWMRPTSRLVAFALGTLVPVLLVMHFQWSAFGSPFRPGHLFVENPGFRVFHERGLFGADALHPEAVVRLLADGRLGAFATTPFLLLAPFGALALLRDTSRRTDALFALALIAALFFPVVMLSNWDGGWVIGPRYLVTVLPLACWLAAHGARSLITKAPETSAIVLGLLGVSFITAGIPSTYYPHLPPEISAPLVEVFGPLISAGYAPNNLGLVLGLPMRLSMLPLGLLALALLVCIGFCAERGSRPSVIATLTIALLALAPALAPTPSPEATRALAFIESTWSPARR